VSGEFPENEDGKWTRMRARLTREQRATVDAALELARKVEGATVPKCRLVAALCEEYLGAHELPDGRDAPPIDSGGSSASGEAVSRADYR